MSTDTRHRTADRHRLTASPLPIASRWST